LKNKEIFKLLLILTCKERDTVIKHTG